MNFNVWNYIHRLLGPGLHWTKDQSVFKTAHERALQENQHEAAGHIAIIWDERNRVMCEKKDPGAEAGAEQSHWRDCDRRVGGE